MILGGWTFRSSPYPDELLSSLLVRNAHLHGAEAYRFVNYFWPGRCVWNRDVDRSADGVWHAEIAARIGIAASQVGACSLAPVAAVLEPAGYEDKGDIRLLLSAGIYHRLRRQHGLQYCAECLASQPAPHFLRKWRFAFLLTCPVHSTPLRDACPCCDSPLMPHRTAPRRIHRCHACGASLIVTGQAQAGELAPAVLRLQQQLLEAAAGGSGNIGAWPAADGLVTVRTLIAIAASFRYAAIRTALGLLPAPASTEEMQFEHARWVRRKALLETAAGLAQDWPARFRRVAAECALTQRSFARASLPTALAAEVAQLPEGQRRTRAYMPVLTTAALRRLRRRDPDAYRAARAAALLAVCRPGVPRRGLRGTADSLQGLRQISNAG